MDFKRELGRYVVQKHVIKALTDENKLLGADLTDCVRELADATGSKAFEAEYDGLKVGTVSVRKKKDETKLAVESPSTLFEWAAAMGYLAAPTVDMGRVQAYFEATGEIPPGCRAETVKGGFQGITARADKEAMAALMSSSLGEAVKGLLEGK